MQTIKTLFLFLLLSTSLSTQAEMVAENFRVMMAPKVARTTAGYGVIKNTGAEADILLSIHSDTVDVMFHKTVIKAGVAKMVHLSDVTIEPGEELVLEPMSYHLMLFDFYSDEFKVGGKINFYLKFKRAGMVEVKALIVTTLE